MPVSKTIISELNDTIKAIEKKKNIPKQNVVPTWEDQFFEEFGSAWKLVGLSLDDIAKKDLKEEKNTEN